MILAVLSALAYASVFAYACSRDARVLVLVAAFGGFGGALLAWTLVRVNAELVPWAVFCLGVAYTIGMIGHGRSLDERSPLVGAGLLLCAELATWSFAERHRIAAERTVVIVRAAGVGALAAAGVAAGGLVLALAGTPGADGLAWTVLGAVAAVVTVAVAARLAARR